VIVPDLKFLVYAYNSDAAAHRPARLWWETCLSETRPVGLSWVVILGYLRLMTSRKVLEDPFSAREVIGHIR
jgi:predicted nucleic acid-binding protein